MNKKPKNMRDAFGVGFTVGFICGMVWIMLIIVGANYVLTRH